VRATSGAKPEVLTHVLLEELAKLDEEKAAGVIPPPLPKPVVAKPPPRIPSRPTPRPTPMPTPMPGSADPTPAPAAAEPAPAAPSSGTTGATPMPAAAPAKKFPVAIAGGAAAIVVVAIIAALSLRGGHKKADEKGGDTQPKTAATAKEQRGITATEVTFGMASPLNGPTSDLGLSMKAGLELAFAQANDAGGVHGRKLKLLALDDRNDPERSAKVVKELIEQRQVFAVVGNAGTTTASAALPILEPVKAIYFGAVSGSPALRKDPPDRYVFNYRPGLAEETSAAMRYLTTVRKIPAEKIAVFAEDDEFGEAGFAGVAESMKKAGRDATQVLRVGYARNSADVDAAVARIRANAQQLKAVVMISTAEPAARFIERVHIFAPQMAFTNVSAVDPTALADRLKEAKVRVGQDVVVTQVVPLATSDAALVARYRSLAEEKSLGDQTGSLSLEGYVVGTLLVEALTRAGPNLDTEGLVKALESMKDLDIGIGTKLSFGERDHQASHKVWGTLLDGAWNYQPVELE
jgi:ABC-type branched-subunit amino acid transport system substrate-binding protein